MKRLEIHTEYARIGIRTHNAKLTINNNIRRFTAEHTPSQPALEEPARVAPAAAQIAKPVSAELAQPQTAPAPMGDVVEISRQFRSAQSVTDPAANAVDGEAQKQAPIRVTRHAAQQVKREAPKVEEQSAPSIEWDVGYTKINWEPYELQINWDEDYMPDFNVEPHSVEIFLENKPSITISVVDDGLMITHGRKLDQKI